MDRFTAWFQATATCFCKCHLLLPKLLSEFINRRKQKAIDHLIDQIVKAKEADHDYTAVIAKKTRTKKGEPIGLVHYAVEGLGKIIILKGSSIDGKLLYTKLDAEYHIGEIRHKSLNQGIGAHFVQGAATVAYLLFGRQPVFNDLFRQILQLFRAPALFFRRR